MAMCSYSMTVLVFHTFVVGHEVSIQGNELNHNISCGNHALYPLFEVCTTLQLVFYCQDSATMIVDHHDY